MNNPKDRCACEEFCGESKPKEVTNPELRSRVRRMNSTLDQLIIKVKQAAARWRAARRS